MRNRSSTQDSPLRRVSPPLSGLSPKFQPKIEPEDPSVDAHGHQAKAAARVGREAGGGLEPQADLLDEGFARHQPQRRHRRRGGDRRVRQRGGVRQPEEAAACPPSEPRASKAGTVSQLQHRRADAEITHADADAVHHAKL